MNNQRNEQHFNSIKNTMDNGVLMYPNLEHFSFDGNNIIYNNTQININFELYMIDSSLFKFSPEEISFTLSVISNYYSQNNELEKEINKTLFLQTLNSLNNEQQMIIIDFLQKYNKIRFINDKYIHDAVTTEYNQRRSVVERAYFGENDIDSNYNKPACTFIRQTEENTAHEALNNGSKEKGYQLVRKTNQQVGLPINDEPPGILNTTAAFASTTLVISITATIGITIAILTLFLTK